MGPNVVKFMSCFAKNRHLSKKKTLGDTQTETDSMVIP
jgi:hypothetical protein